MEPSNIWAGSKESSTACDISEVGFSARITEILKEELSIDESFIWLYTLTMAMYDLEEKENPCSKGYIKRWTDLGDIWGLCAQKCGEPNLFMLALHRIHWGIYPKNFPERIPIEMVEYLERALLQDNECNKGWKKNDYYRDAFDDVVNQGCPVGDHMLRYRSSWYCRYISNRTWLTVVYKGREAPTIDLSNYTRAEFVSAKKQASVFAEYHAYVKVVTTLIPEAAKWDSAQWLNERFLYRQLKHRFGISARDLDECWDPTVSFLIDLWYYKKISVEKLLRIKRMPDVLMKAIWPQDTVWSVTKLFRNVCSRVKSAHTYLGKYNTPVRGCSWSRVKTSWLFSRCRSWVYSNDVIYLAPGVKRKVMELDTGIVA